MIVSFWSGDQVQLVRMDKRRSSSDAETTIFSSDATGRSEVSYSLMGNYLLDNDQ
jgi:hypothetical protein